MEMVNGKKNPCKRVMVPFRSGFQLVPPRKDSFWRRFSFKVFVSGLTVVVRILLLPSMGNLKIMQSHGFGMCFMGFHGGKDFLVPGMLWKG